MRSSLVTFAVAALFGLAAATPASAQQDAPAAQSVPAQADQAGGLPSFGDLDKQNHGYLTRSDIPKNIDGLKQLRAHFKEADADHNSRLSPTEYAIYVQSQKSPSELPPGGSGH